MKQKKIGIWEKRKNIVNEYEYNLKSKKKGAQKGLNCARSM